MNIKPYDKTIRDLLGSKRQFVIPRFQREYSWDKKNYQEFLEDMVSNLEIIKGKITSSQYFLGTMLFIGNFTEGTDQVIQVVDGQQRLTTITILFSAMSDRFKELGESTLSKQLFTYIMTEDDNGDEVRILKSKTSYPYFAYFIQDKEKSTKQEANSEEETCIKQTYTYFRSQLKKDKLYSMLKRKHGSNIVEALTEVDILKALRDQVLNSTFVSISTTDREQANRIFEILNAKGKKLADIDLIKNRIFEVLNKEEPADYAEEKWKEIKNTLNTGKETVGLATFYRHFWISKHKLTYSNKLYDRFSATIVKSEAAYKSFLEDMLHDAKIYMTVVNPSRDTYNNRKEYFWLVQSLHTLNEYFNVVQVRIALLALINMKEKEVISFATFKKTVLYLENFHFVYNSLLGGSTNIVERTYSTFAIETQKVTDKETAQKVIKEKLYEALEPIIPSFDEFATKFSGLTYSKTDSAMNLKTKYVINRLNCYYSGKELFEDDGSVEHIIPESSEGKTLSIGNLILLEQCLNSRAGEQPYQQKISIYSESKYNWIHQFCEKYKTWDASMIDARTQEMAKTYYEKVLERKI